MKKKIIFLSTGLSLVLLVGGWFLFGQNYYKADAIDDAFFSECRRLVNKNIPVDTSGIPKKLEAKYKIVYPTVNDAGKFWFDFDTYAKSWDEYPGGAVTGQARLQEIKTKIPSIVTEINKVYGNPYNQNGVIIVYDKNFSDSSKADSLNEWGLNYIGGQYRPDLNLIVYGSGEVTNEQLIHEMVHAYNDGALPVDAYEEGLVESTTRKVAKALFPESISPTLKETNKRYTLSTPMGIFRTIDDDTIVQDRYDASTKLIEDQLAVNPNFIKDFRLRYQKQNKFFPDLLKQSHKTLQKMVVNAACGELTDHSNFNSINQYSLLVEEELFAGLSTAVKAIDKSTGRFSSALNIVKENPIVNIMPFGMLYSDISYNRDSDDIEVYSIFKRGDIKDIIMTMYIQEVGPPPTRSVGLQTLGNFLSNSNIATSASLQDYAYLMEEPADTLILTVYKGKETLYIEKFPKAKTDEKLTTGGAASASVVAEKDPGEKPFDDTIIDDGTSKLTTRTIAISPKSLLEKAGLASDYTGNLEIVAETSKKSIATKQYNQCYHIPLGHVCYPRGLKYEDKNFGSTSFVVYYFEAGKIKNVVDSTTSAGGAISNGDKIQLR